MECQKQFFLVTLCYVACLEKYLRHASRQIYFEFVSLLKKIQKEISTNIFLKSKRQRVNILFCVKSRFSKLSEEVLINPFSRFQKNPSFNLFVTGYFVANPFAKVYF